MERIRRKILWTVILAVGLWMFTFAEDVVKTIQAVESNAGIIYNGMEVNLGLKPYSIEGSNYLSVRALALLFDKNIEWKQEEKKIYITDKPDIRLEGLKTELAAKNNSIQELQNKVKKLEAEAGSKEKTSLRELQERINEEYGEFEGVTYRVILSGDVNEVRVKLEVDLSRDKAAWNRLSSQERDQMIDDVCSVVTEEYASAKIKGYIKDISGSNKLTSFHYTWDGKLKNGSYRNYSSVSTLEDSFNNSYGNYFKDMHFTYAVGGNDSNIEYTIYIQKNRFEDKWDKLTDGALKNFMKKLCSEIGDEFKDCHIYGYVYDTDSGRELAICEQIPDGDFEFGREEY